MRQDHEIIPDIYFLLAKHPEIISGIYLVVTEDEEITPDIYARKKKLANVGI